MSFTEVGNGVFTRRYEFLDQNIGVVIGSNGVLVIDTRSSHRHAAELLSELPSLTKLPVRWVVNTHWHWDHTFGNAMFPDAELWGHVEARRVLLDNGDAGRESAKEYVPPEEHADVDAVVITPPTHLIDATGSIDIGGRTVTLDHLGLGHTEGDIVLRFSDDPVLWAGDLLEEGWPPSFGDSYPISWPATVKALAGIVSGPVIPGHGGVMDAAAVATQQEELEAVAAIATNAHAASLPVDAVSLEKAPYPEDFMRTALERAYLELDA